MGKCFQCGKKLPRQILDGEDVGEVCIMLGNHHFCSEKCKDKYKEYRKEHPEECAEREKREASGCLGKGVKVILVLGIVVGILCAIGMMAGE